MRSRRVPVPMVGDPVLHGDGRWGRIAKVCGPTVAGLGSNDGTHAVLSSLRGERILYVDPMGEDGWTVGGEDFQDRDPYHEGRQP